MLSYIRKTAAKSYNSYVISTILLSLLFTSVPISMSGLQSTKLTTEQSISQFARGTYDILVRPDSQRTEVEKAYGLVEENYLSGGKGGISLEQYEKIRQLGGVEAAAPVAVLGFFTNHTGSLDVDVPPDLYKAPTLTSIKIYKDNGLPLDNNDVETTHLLTLPNQESSFFTNRPMGLNLGPNNEVARVSFALPQTYNLLVGIDSEQEAKMLGVNTELLPSLPKQIPYFNTPEGKRVPEIPLLVNADSTSVIKVQVETRKPTQSTQELIDRLNGLTDLSQMSDKISDISQTVPTQTKTYILGKVSPFQVNHFYVSSDSKVSTSPNGMNFILKTSSYYESQRLAYKKSDSTSDYELLPFLQGQKSLYRQLDLKGQSNSTTDSELMFKPDVIGSYQAHSFNSDKLNPSPLGIYSFTPFKWSNTEISAGFSPNTFLPLPATALTNLEASVFVKGDHPIDAIRVRIAGINGYDTTAETKITHIAKQIQDITGLHTDIVAGSSKQFVKVEIPQVSNHPALGVIEETWTTLGVATKIGQAINQLSVWLTGGLLLLVLIFTVVQTQTMFLARQGEFAILRSIGWSYKEVRKMMLLEWGIKSSIAMIPAIATIYYSKHFINHPSYWILSLTVQMVIVILLFLAVWWTISRLHSNSLIVKKRVKDNSERRKTPSIISFMFKNFTSQFNYNFWLILLISISGSVALFTLNVTLAQQKNIGVTFLGAEVITAGHTALWFIVCSSVVMVWYGVWEASRALIFKRESEINILRIIGWTKNHIHRLIMSEMILILMIGFSFAILIGLGTFRVFFENFPLALLMQGGYLLGVSAILFSHSLFIVQKFTSKIS